MVALDSHKSHPRNWVGNKCRHLQHVRLYKAVHAWIRTEREQFSPHLGTLRHCLRKGDRFRKQTNARPQSAWLVPPWCTGWHWHRH